MNMKRRRTDGLSGKLQIGSYVAIITLTIAVLGLWSSGVRWVQHTNDRIKHNEEKVSSNQDALKCVGDLKVQVAKTVEKVSSVDSKLDLLIRLTRDNGHDKYGRTD